MTHLAIWVYTYIKFNQEKGKKNFFLKSLSPVRPFVTLWTIAYQAPLSVKLSRQEYGSGLPFHSPGDLLDPGIESRSPMLQADSLPTEPPGYKTKQETMLLNICTLVC